MRDLPISWRPKGRPNLSFPVGTLIAGRPAKLAVTVNTSFKYMSSGFFFFSSLILNAEDEYLFNILNNFLCILI